MARRLVVPLGVAALLGGGLALADGTYPHVNV